MPGVVFIGGAHGDFVSRVVAGELVGCACLVGNRLPIAQPLVLHVSGYAIVIANSSGQRLPDFRFAAEGDFPFVIGLRDWIRLRVGLRIRCRDVSNCRCCLA